VYDLIIVIIVSDAMMHGAEYINVLASKTLKIECT